MIKIGLITDAGADLPKEITEKNQIEVVPVKMFWPEIDNLSGENVFQKTREAEKMGVKTFGKTSQSALQDFLLVFKKQLSIFENIIYIGLSSKLSDTFNVAVQAKNFLEEDLQKRIFFS